MRCARLRGIHDRPSRPIGGLKAGPCQAPHKRIRDWVAALRPTEAVIERKQKLNGFVSASWVL